MRGYKYEPLKKYLTQTNVQTITLSFSEVAEILKADLPPCLSGFEYSKRLLWNNNAKNHATRSWLEAGYICLGYDETNQNVTFEKNPVEAVGCLDK